MRIIVCGATGSIGQQALDVIKKENYELVGFTFNSNVNLASKILKDFPNTLCYSSSKDKLNNVYDLDAMIDKTKPDMILNAVVGFAGLKVTLKAIEKNIDLALANKESLVVAGWLIKKLLLNSKSKIYPIDSEHSSLYDMLINNKKNVESITLTASGGPFFDKPFSKLKNVDFEKASKHPTWKMGYKISIDSATLMNKCFEIIEAYYLFNTNSIKVLRHKDSIVHSIVSFEDGSNWLNTSLPDMKWAIQMGLSKYRSNQKIIKNLNFEKLNLSFEKVDSNKWLPIKWAFEFIETSNYTIPIVLNSANEELIELFKNKKIKFTDIISNLEKNVQKFKELKVNNLKDIYFLDYLVKESIRKEFS